MTGLVETLKNKWYLLSFHLPVFRRRRWREVQTWKQGDGDADPTFLIERVQTPGMVVYVNPEAIFYKGNGLFVDASYEAGARRSVTRNFKLVRDLEGFMAIHHSEGAFVPRKVSDDQMPDSFFPITNANLID